MLNCAFVLIISPIKLFLFVNLFIIGISSKNLIFSSNDEIFIFKFSISFSCLFIILQRSFIISLSFNCFFGIIIFISPNDNKVGIIVN